MLEYLAFFDNAIGPLRLFKYVTFRAGGALMTSLLIAYFLGPFTVRFLKSLGANAPARLEGLVKEEFVDRRKDKVPSMGGVLIVFSIIISTFLWATPTNPLVIVFVATLFSLALVGFLDDYSKVAHGKRDGIPGKAKLALQVLIALCGAWYLDCLPATGSSTRDIMLPFLKNPLLMEIPILVALAFAALVVVSSSNAVNLTDGKDGLAVGCSVFCTLTYAVFAYMCGHRIFAAYLNIPFIPGASEVTVFAAAIVGACLGFLWYNCHPASMFMGDTGSLALGGSIGLIAVLVRQELTLVLVGGVFVMEAVSVILQVISFKLFKRRIFRCTPIHHHFEQLGWTETQIVVRFWILSGLFAMIGLATLKIR